MKYYSETTKKLYDTPEELKKDEKAVLKEKQEKEKKQQELQLARKQDAKVVEAATEKVRTAYKDLQKAQEELRTVKKQFLDKYGVYHYTTTDPNDPAFDFIREAIKDMNTFMEKFNPFSR